MSNSRLKILAYQEEGTLHEMWRCHNKARLLKDKKIKAMYLHCIGKAFAQKQIRNTIALRAYCTMDNHIHMMTTFERGIHNLSNYMRYKNSLFGKAYNKKHQRTGKVANERPKTQLIQNSEHEMRVHFYIEANPLRAKITTLSKLKNYKYSSYKFYAYGITDEFTHFLTPPDWYNELASTDEERQIEFRRLFKEYIGTSDEGIEKNCFIGSNVWIISLTEEIKSKTPKLQLEKSNHDPPSK